MITSANFDSDTMLRVARFIGDMWMLQVRLSLLLVVIALPILCGTFLVYRITERMQSHD